MVKYHVPRRERQGTQLRQIKDGDTLEKENYKTRTMNKQAEIGIKLMKYVILLMNKKTPKQ
jgi:hypothetical protein